MPHSPFGQRLTDKAWGTNNLHLREAHPSPTEGPACSNAGCDCVRGGRMASLLFERIRPVCCLGRRKGPRSSQRSRTHRGRCEARGHPVTQRQHPESREARLGIRDHIQSLCDAGILAEGQSPWSTPLLPVKKPGGNDFHVIDSAVVTIDPAVPNPHTLLSLLPAQVSWFTCLDPEDAFFSLRDHRPARPCSPSRGKTRTPGERRD